MTENGMLGVSYTFLDGGGLEYQLGNALGVTRLGSGFHCPDANSTDKEVLKGLLLEEIISLTLGD
jgi:hypothetical protein